MLKTLWQTQLTDVKTTDVEGIGRLRVEDDGKMYRWVQNDEASTTIAAGQACCHTFTDGAASVANVKLPATATLGFLAGVPMADIAAASYGWVQCHGQNTIAQVFQSQTTAKVAGATLKAANAATYVDTDSAMGTAPIYTRTMVLLDAVATVTTGAPTAKNVYIRCL